MDVKKQLWPGWETVGVLGSGSFGSVYEIQRDVYGRTEKAALKTVSIPQFRGEVEDLRQEGYDDASITARFHSYLEDIVKEYALMSELKGHGNIVYCDDFREIQQEDGIGWDLYIKMELLTPLMKALPGDIPAEEAVKVGVDLCNALILCKSKNIIHRDIKPQNIFVSQSGDYKLGDFGVARTAERTVNGTKTGTVKFMAPEVYRVLPYNSTVDIYSLGLVLYWLLNKRRTPFLPLPPAVPKRSEDEDATQRRMTGEALPEPACGSRELKQVVLKACAFDPKDRYQTPQELQQALLAVPEWAGVATVKPERVTVESHPVWAEEDRTVGVFYGQKHTVQPETDENDRTEKPQVLKGDWTAEEDDRTVGVHFGRPVRTTPEPVKSVPAVVAEPVKPVVPEPPVSEAVPEPEQPPVEKSEKKPKKKPKKKKNGLSVSAWILQAVLVFFGFNWGLINGCELGGIPLLLILTVSAVIALLHGLALKRNNKAVSKWKIWLCALSPLMNILLAYLIAYLGEELYYLI